jgi:putative peptide zinc metalloprotease protein
LFNLRRSFFGPLLVLALAISPAVPALAAEDNAAVAINNEDGSSLFRFAFDVHRTMNSVIDETNIALAYASCEGCQTVAVAIQIVLVSSSPDSIVPENVAISINEECTSCETMASAYQFVVGTGENIKLDKAGRKMVKDIRKAFYDLAVEAEAGNLTLAEIEGRIIPLVDQIKTVLDEHIIPVTTPEGEGNGLEGRDEEGADGQDGDSGTEESPSPEPSTSATPSAEPEESPSPEETPAVEAAPSPTAEASS